MDLFGKKASPAKERITPHKISLLVLITEICEPDVGSVFGTHRHALLLLVLSLIQTADLTLNELCSKLNELDEKEGITAFLLQRLKDLQESEVGIGDFFHIQLNNLFNTENEVVLTRTSFFGLFVRKMLLLYNKMSFGQILHLTSLLEKYIAKSPPTDRVEYEATTPARHAPQVPVSSRQAENFLTRQALLMQSHEQAADSPMKLQEHIISILEGAPDLAEAYFVQYLNCVRVGEFSKAMDHLYHYFDRKKWENAPTTETDEVKKERCKRFCYAALNLAILHTHFNHREEALTALQESIRIAQESNDHICLAHGLRLLYTLNQEGDSHAKQMLDRFRGRATELKIPYLESLSCLLKTKRMVFDGISPPIVLNAFNDVNILNSEKSLADLAAITHVQRTACLEFYGKSNMAVVHCQLPLHHWQMSLKVAGPEVLDGKSTSGLVNSEATVRSLCYLASHVYQQGSFDDAMKILDFAKTIHSESSKSAKFWQAERQKIIFDRALLVKDWCGAERAVTDLRVYDVVEANLRSARLKIKRGSYDGARNELRSILGSLEKAPDCGEDEKSCHEIKANVYLALGELCIAVGDHASCLTHLLECKALCDLYHMENLAAITCLSIVEVQLHVNLPEKAKKLINEVMIQILSHGSLMTRCRAKLLLVRCDLVLSRKQLSDHRKTALLAALSTLDVISKNVEKLRYSEMIKEVLFYQTFVYNELGYVEKRNQCALEYRSIQTASASKIRRKSVTRL